MKEEEGAGFRIQARSRSGFRRMRGGGGGGGGGEFGGGGGKWIERTRSRRTNDAAPLNFVPKRGGAERYFLVRIPNNDLVLSRPHSLILSLSLPLPLLLAFLFSHQTAGDSVLSLGVRRLSGRSTCPAFVYHHDHAQVTCHCMTDAGVGLV